MAKTLFPWAGYQQPGVHSRGHGPHSEDYITLSALKEAKILYRLPPCLQCPALGFLYVSLGEVNAIAASISFDGVALTAVSSPCQESSGGSRFVP